MNIKDLLTGVLFLIIGAPFFYYGLVYNGFVLTYLGPGYFPLVVSALLMLIGVALIARAVCKKF